MQREKVVFWLRKDKPDEAYLLDLVYYLKSKREFVRTIRDGLRLVYALRQREWDILFDMFPEFEADVDKRILEAKLAAYEHAATRPIQLIQQQAQAILVEQSSEPHQQHATPALTAPPVPDPEFEDDDDISLDIRAVRNGDSAQNFLNSVEALR